MDIHLSEPLGVDRTVPEVEISLWIGREVWPQESWYRYGMLSLWMWSRVYGSFGSWDAICEDDCILAPYPVAMALVTASRIAKSSASSVVTFPVGALVWDF